MRKRLIFVENSLKEADNGNFRWVIRQTAVGRHLKKKLHFNKT